MKSNCIWNVLHPYRGLSRFTTFETINVVLFWKQGSWPNSLIDGGDMVRPKRGDDWVPLTVRLAPDAARRLRVAAARRGITQGRLLDEILLAHLPPADPLPSPEARRHPDGEPLTAEGLRREMGRLGLTQAALAEVLKIGQKSVSEWFSRGRIPLQRHETIRKILVEARKVMKKR